VNTKALFTRTLASWRLAFDHAGQMLNFLTRAVLLSLASASVGLAFLFCWVDRFRSSKAAEWVIPGRAVAPGKMVTSERSAAIGRMAAPMPKTERRRPVAVAERYPVPKQDRTHHQPRTIDSMIRSKGARL